MKKKILEEIIKYKKKKIEFTIVTNLENGENIIFENDKPLSKNFEKFVTFQYQILRNFIKKFVNLKQNLIQDQKIF